MTDQERLERLQQAVDEHERELAHAVSDIRAATGALTGTSWLRRHPLGVLAGGLLAGLCLGWRRH
jgi:uncharacterized protein involved in exopolysaccharide biosynthesis